MLHKVTHENQRKTLADAVKQSTVDTKISEGRKVKVRDDMLTMKRGLRDDRRDHVETETVIRKVGLHVTSWLPCWMTSSSILHINFSELCVS
jgi:hypothetical protein